MSRPWMLALAAVLAWPGIPSQAQELSSGRPPMTSKMKVENPVEGVLRKTSPLADWQDVLRRSSAQPAGSLSSPGDSTRVPPGSASTTTADARKLQAGAAATEAKRERLAGKHVMPGMVAWHADFASACKLAKTSGKPVLLFQMMGKLDDEFC